MKYGFIGCGHMGSALAEALSKTTKDFMLANRTPEKAKALAEKTGGKYGTNEEVASSCDRIFLGVKPQGMESLLFSLRPVLQKKKPLLITMAAGLSTKRIAEFAGYEAKVIRIMPNTPVAVGKGMILCAAGSSVTQEELSSFVSDMKEAGFFDAVSEEQMDAGCSLSGCGPAFMYMMMEALADGAVACGLPRQKALAYAAQTMLGSAELVLQTGEHPEALKDAVCSPGGSTVAGVLTLEKAGFRSACAEAVKAAFARNKELGGEKK